MLECLKGRFTSLIWVVSFIVITDSLGLISRHSNRGYSRLFASKQATNTLRFISHDSILIESSDFSHNIHRVPLLFLPGLDGVGNYSSQTFANISKSFDIRRLQIDSIDRSTFTEIADRVIDHLETSYTEPPILMGESFGGLLASYIASKKSAKPLISKLVLVNPATSFDRTLWSVLGPAIASTGPAFSVVGISTLLATVIEMRQIRTIGQSIVDRIKNFDDLTRELNVLLDSSATMTRLLNPDTLNWRLTQWLENGAYLMKDRYKEIEAPTLVIVGRNDRLLPSGNEGKRLAKEMKKARVDLQEFSDRGLDNVFKNSEIFRDNLSTRDMASYDVKFPCKKDIADIDRQLQPLVRGTSPVFLSTAKGGRIEKGIRQVPVSKDIGRPVLLVGNHQLYGADLGLIIKKFIDDKECLPRGLAHPVIFSESSEFGGSQMDIQADDASASTSQEGMRSLFSKFGAVEVSPGSIFELMKRNETVLLFPGGVREAYHGKGEAYTLFWPEKTDFVRMASLFNAVIVPFSAIGIADSVNMLLDADEILNIPVIGDRIRKNSKDAPNARPGVEDQFIAPLIFPKMPPSRVYFLFHEAYDTAGLNVYDKKACRELYTSIKNKVSGGINSLCKFRDEDPFKEFIPRVAYESVTQLQAPTAPLNLKF